MPTRLLASYAAAKTRVWSGAGTCIGYRDGPQGAALLAAAPGRQVPFTLAVPRVGEVGRVEELLVDRAYPDVAGEASALASLADVPVLDERAQATSLPKIVFH